MSIHLLSTTRAFTFLLFVLLAGPAPAADLLVSGTTVKLGDSVAQAQAALGTQAAPTSFIRDEPEKKMLQAKDKGVQVFFQPTTHLVYIIRFDAPFAGAVGSARIGMTRAQLEKTLGPPAADIRNPPSIPGTPPLYGYHIDGKSLARFVFDESEKVVTIFVQ